MNLGIKVTGISLKGINVPGMLRGINEGSDVYRSGSPLQIGNIYQHIRPANWAWQGFSRKVLGRETLAHVSGRFDICRALDDGYQVVAKAKFESQEFSRGNGALETEDSLTIKVREQIFIGALGAYDPIKDKTDMGTAKIITPGTIEIKTVSGKSGPASVVKYVYSAVEGGSLIRGLPIDQVIPSEMFLV